MKKIIKKLYYNDIVRYIFFGCLTVAVNLISFYVLLNFLKLNLDLSNILSITIALLFAYITNTIFVFHSKGLRFTERLLEFIKFIMARFFTMFFEVWFVHYTVSIINFKEMYSKFIAQIIVIILNYVFSKLIVYKK